MIYFSWYRYAYLISFFSSTQVGTSDSVSQWCSLLVLHFCLVLFVFMFLPFHIILLFSLGERGEIFHRNRGKQSDERTEDRRTVFLVNWNVPHVTYKMVSAILISFWWKRMEDTTVECALLFWQVEDATEGLFAHCFTIDCLCIKGHLYCFFDPCCIVIQIYA